MTAPSRGRGAAPPPPPPQDAFPSGIYGKYKRATAFFLDWLLRARNGGVAVNVAAAKTTKSSLDVYERIVAAIARAPSELDPAAYKSWPHALDACECAITLRSRVALFFAPNAGDQQHAYFLERLQSWLTTLKQAYRATLAQEIHGQKTKCHPPMPTAIKEPDFTSYYEVLDLPDDFFCVDDREIPSLSADFTPLSAADREGLFDKAFVGELVVELVCFFLELEELSEAVYSAYLDVKRQKKTLVEATAVAKVAIDGAAHVTARLQLRYPSVRDARDLTVMVTNFLPVQDAGVLYKTVQAAWGSKPDSHSEPKNRYVAGTVLFDVLWVTQALQRIVPGLQACKGRKLGTSVTFHGETYSEEDTPQYVVPDLVEAPAFLRQQIPLLVNYLLDRSSLGLRLDMASFEGWFLEPLESFFESMTVSIPAVFTCIC